MTVLFTDPFTGTLSATNYTDEATQWSTSGGELLCGTSSFRVLNTTTSAHALLADCRLIFTRRSATFDGGVVARSTISGATSSIGNCYVINPFGTQVDVIRRIAGVNTTVAGGLTSITYANGDIFTVDVKTTGATVTFDCFINATPIGTVTDSSGLRLLNTGATGFVVFNSACRFDDFSVDDLASPVALLSPLTFQPMRTTLRL